MSKQAKRWDVLCAGIVNVNILFQPVPGDFMERDVTVAQKMEILCGGDAVNQAVVLSNLGKRVAIGGKIGEDDFGKIIRSQIGAHGIDTEPLRIESGLNSGTCIVMVRPDGQRNFLSHRGAMERYCLEDFDPELLDRTKIISIGSLFAVKGLDGLGVTEIFRQAKARDVITVADTKADIHSLGYGAIRELMSLTDYFMPSYDEAMVLSKETKPEKMADVFLSDGAKNVVIKLGENGVYAKNSEESFYQPAFEARVVDTTGAGDNFVAGFIAALLEGDSFRECARFASGVAAVSVGALGAHGGVVSRSQVNDFLKNAQQREDRYA